MQRRLILLNLLALGACGAAGAAGANYRAQSTITDFTDECMPIVNNLRARYGLGSLTPNGNCRQAAIISADLMAQTGQMAHQIDGVGALGNPLTRFDRSGVRRPAAENIAFGYRNTERVTLGWEKSPGHLKNMINKNYRQFALVRATHPATNGVLYWCMVLSA